MNPNTDITIVQGSARDLAQYGIVLDADQSAQEKMRRAYNLNLVYVPVMRLLGFMIVATAVFLNNRFILKFPSNSESYLYISISISYCFFSWGILYLFFTKIKNLHLGESFFIFDIFVIILGIYMSGGEKSFVFPMFTAWVGIQTSTTFKRVLNFAATTIFGYILFILYLDFIEHRTLSWPTEFTKIFILVSTSLFVTLAAKLTERMRAKMSSAIRMARQFILQLQDQTHQLEEARAKLETLYLNEQDVSRTLKELNQMKTNFLIVTSHEMRTPLTVIKGYNEALLNQLFGSLTTAQKRSLETCQHAVDRLSITLEDILEMVKIHEGHIILKLKEIDLHQIIQQILDEFSPYVTKRQQHISLEGPKTLKLMADYDKVHLIFLNLIQNAIKFTYDDGTIHIRLQAGPTHVMVTIQDSGIGIEPLETEKIFEKFYINSDAAHHSSGDFQFSARGTGLGLSIAQSYVEAHQGRIWAESEGRGKGSCFYVELPISQGAVKEL